MNELNVDYFVGHAQKYSNFFSESKYSVEALIAIYERAILYGDEHLYTDPYLIVQLSSGAQGACFLHLEDWNTAEFDMIAGRPVLEIVSNTPIHIKVALLDALYHHINIIEGINPSAEYQFQGTGSEKSLLRAQKLIELANIERGNKVAIVGLIVDILKMALEKGAQVKVADLAEAGKRVCGLLIEQNAMPLVKWADTAIITGNTLKTNTLNQILKIARDNSVNVLVYSMTGHNISPRYLNYGANIVTSESFPYYWYANTSSTMCIYRKNAAS